MTKDRRLGRGLAALLGTPADEQGTTGDGAAGGGPPANSPKNPAPSRPALRVHRGDESVEANEGDEPIDQQRTEGDEGEDLLKLNVYEIDDNPFQPRREFREAEIASLAESLKSHEMLQPILVRRVGERYQLISGERRLRAAIQAGWSTVPARLRDADDRLVAELAIVENLQRKDLNAVEKALSFKRYIEQHRCTQEDLARRLKIDRSTIANLIRLLELPDDVIACLRNETLSAGHARALLPLGDEGLQREFCGRIQSEGWSVRDTERLVSERIAKEDGEASVEIAAPAARSRKKVKSEQVASLEQELRMVMGTKVEVRQMSRGRGRIVIHFSGHNEFERLWAQLTTDGGVPRARSA